MTTDFNFSQPTTAADPPPPAQPSRQLGALWLTAAGGILVMLAAMIFVAVNWDRIADETKIISLALVTAGIGFAGWRLEDRLPVGSTVLTHLAAGLVPVNVAAVAVNTSSNNNLTVAITAWTALAVSSLMIALRRSILVEIAAVASAPIAVIATARAAGLTGTESALIAIAIGIPVWCIGVLSDARYARWAGFAFPVVGAMSAGAVAILSESSGANAPFGAALMVVGLFVMLEGVRDSTQDRIWLGSAATLVGWWILANLATIQAIEAYLWPAGVLLLVPSLMHLHHNPSAPSWPALLPGLSLLALAPIAELVGGGSVGHVLAAVVVGVGAMALGAWYRYGAALFVGTATLIATVVLETWTLAVGVDTWAWLAVAGGALIGIGIALERADTSPIAASRSMHDAFHAAYR